MTIPTKLRISLEKRDKKRCAYCLTSEDNCGLKMHVDHITPEASGGDTTSENLCLACFSCNVHKGAKQTGLDPITQEITQLFHPLKQKWNEHFRWDENKEKIIGLSPCGRATISILKMNNPTVANARKRWVSAGWHPPKL